MTTSMSHGNRWWRTTSKLYLRTRFVCSRRRLSTNSWLSLFLDRPGVLTHRSWTHDNRDLVMLLKETLSLQVWEYHERPPFTSSSKWYCAQHVISLIWQSYVYFNVMEILTHKPEILHHGPDFLLDTLNSGWVGVFTSVCWPVGKPTHPHLDTSEYVFIISTSTVLSYPQTIWSSRFFSVAADSNMVVLSLWILARISPNTVWHSIRSNE